MPELPEVETTRRGITPHVMHRHIAALTVRERRLRWPVSDGLESRVSGRRVVDVGRRAKYLLITLDDDSTLILHLGMSGSLRVVARDTAPQPHDHVDLAFTEGAVLRFNDPRRFGSLHHAAAPVAQHPLLAGLGPEPLGADFDGDWLYERARGRRAPVKSFLMDNRTVVGVGNIYATEALHLAGIHPGRPAGRIARKRYHALGEAVVAVLEAAIEAGGTTLRDFSDVNGRPGYFSQRLDVYGRAGAPCRRCGGTLRARLIGQRTTAFCPRCQR